MTTTTSNNFKHDGTFPLGMALPLSLCGAQECPVWVFGLVLLRSGSTALFCFASIVLKVPSIVILVVTRVTPILSPPGMRLLARDALVDLGPAALLLRRSSSFRVYIHGSLKKDPCFYSTRGRPLGERIRTSP